MFSILRINIRDVLGQVCNSKKARKAAIIHMDFINKRHQQYLICNREINQCTGAPAPDLDTQNLKVRYLSVRTISLIIDSG